MSDEQYGGLDGGSAEDQQGTEAPPADADTVARPVRRPRRPAPSAAYMSGRRARADERPGLNPIIVPIFAVVALLALVAAIVFDRVHNSASTPAATPTWTPLPTPAPTATPMTLPDLPTTKAGVAAEANGEVVPMDLFNSLFKVDTKRVQQTQQDPNTGTTTPGVDLRTAAGRKALYTQVNSDLKNLIDGAILDAYAKAHNLVATKAQIDTQLVAAQSSYGGASAFTQTVTAQGYTMDVVNKLIADQATGQNVYNQIIKGAGCPCDLHIRQILLKVKDQALASKLAAELQANHGATFAAVAKKYSTDTATASQGGDMGFVSQGTNVAEFDKAAWALKPNQISNPVKASDGWHIIQVLGSRPSATSQSGYFKKWLDAQRAKATIHTYVQIPKS